MCVRVRVLVLVCAFVCSRSPFARVGLVVYLLLVHVWAAFVFGHLMREFGEEQHDEPPRSLHGITNRQ